MTFTLKLTLSAEYDVEDAMTWYNTARAGLGLAFFIELQELLERIRLFPESCPIVRRGSRCLSMHIFPYNIFYRIVETQVEVFAVIHSSRNPKHWQERIH